MNEETSSSSPPKREGWLDPKRNQRRVVFGLFATCALFFLIDAVLWLTHFDKHPYFRWEQWPGFYAVYAFGAGVLLVLLARLLLRPLVKRSEDYYDQ
jgi:hypothetical protein